MSKKITLILLITFLLFSCGQKEMVLDSNPEAENKIMKEKKETIIKTKEFDIEGKYDSEEITKSNFKDIYFEYSIQEKEVIETNWNKNFENHTDKKYYLTNSGIKGEKALYIMVDSGNKLLIYLNDKVKKDEVEQVEAENKDNKVEVEDSKNENNQVEKETTQIKNDIAENKEEKNLEKLTIENISLHNSKEDCMTTVEGKVYELTDFFGKHGGGDENLLKICGKDGTEIFLEQHGGNEGAQNMLKNFYKGELEK